MLCDALVDEKIVSTLIEGKGRWENRNKKEKKSTLQLREFRTIKIFLSSINIFTEFAESARAQVVAESA